MDQALFSLHLEQKEGNRSLREGDLLWLPTYSQIWDVGHWFLQHESLASIYDTETPGAHTTFPWPQA